jgi:transcriptional regulator with GAF, ATPase, and Fis domain
MTAEGGHTGEVVIAAAESPFTFDPSSIPPAELQRSFRRLTLLYHLGQQICAESHLDRVFDTVLSAITQLLDAERAFVAVTDGDKLRTPAIRQVGPTDSMPWPSSNTLLKRVLTQGVSVLTNDARQESPSTSVLTNDLRSVMCCPLGGTSRPRGLLYVDNRCIAGAFSRSDLEFLRALAQYAGLAIANAEAQREAVRKRELTEAQLAGLCRTIAAGGEQIQGKSPRFLETVEQVRKAARKDVSVILVGETGSGKELLARELHASSARSSGPYVALNLRVFPATLIEAELFGHERGTYTGASERRIGWLEAARGGTILIDEAQDIPLDVQAKLLRVLEERVFQRLGGRDNLDFDARVVAAFSKDPMDAVKNGTLRDDLYYRLATVTIEVPPLRDHPQDVPLLAEYFLRRVRSQKSLDPDVMACLSRYRWPGNVRELLHCMEGLDAMVDDAVIRLSDLPLRIRSLTDGASSTAFPSLAQEVSRAERVHFQRALEAAAGSNERAQQLLGVSRATFFQRKKEFGL